MTIEEWIANDIGLDRVHTVSQMFVKLGRAHTLLFIPLRLPDDLLFAGGKLTTVDFVSKVKKRFQITKPIIDSHINFHGCRIAQATKWGHKLVYERRSGINIKHTSD